MPSLVSCCSFPPSRLVLIGFLLGGFIAGLIIPKDNGFAISVVEKLEDFVSLILIPQVKSIFLAVLTQGLTPAMNCINSTLLSPVSGLTSVFWTTVSPGVTRS
jgi:fructose-specific phosphotransferase system IIC component